MCHTTFGICLHQKIFQCSSKIQIKLRFLYSVCYMWQPYCGHYSEYQTQIQSIGRHLSPRKSRRSMDCTFAFP